LDEQIAIVAKDADIVEPCRAVIIFKKASSLHQLKSRLTGSTTALCESLAAEIKRPAPAEIKLSIIVTHAVQTLLANIRQFESVELVVSI
jgi:hypothetical protein